MKATAPRYVRTATPSLEVKLFLPPLEPSEPISCKEFDEILKETEEEPNLESTRRERLASLDPKPIPVRHFRKKRRRRNQTRKKAA